MPASPLRADLCASIQQSVDKLRREMSEMWCTVRMTRETIEETRDTLRDADQLLKRG